MAHTRSLPGVHVAADVIVSGRLLQMERLADYLDDLAATAAIPLWRPGGVCRQCCRGALILTGTLPKIGASSATQEGRT